MPPSSPNLRRYDWIPTPLSSKGLWKPRPFFRGRSCAALGQGSRSEEDQGTLYILRPPFTICITGSRPLDPVDRWTSELTGTVGPAPDRETDVENETEVTRWGQNRGPCRVDESAPGPILDIGKHGVFVCGGEVFVQFAQLPLGLRSSHHRPRPPTNGPPNRNGASWLRNEAP